MKGGHGLQISCRTLIWVHSTVQATVHPNKDPVTMVILKHCGQKSINFTMDILAEVVECGHNLINITMDMTRVPLSII